MTDSRIENFARILVDHSAQIKPGDRVAIEATTAAEPLIKALYATILEREASRTCWWSSPRWRKSSLNLQRMHSWR